MKNDKVKGKYILYMQNVLKYAPIKHWRLNNRIRKHEINMTNEELNRLCENNSIRFFF